MPLPKVVILSSLLLTDRTILYNNFLPALSKHAEVYLWPTSADLPPFNKLDIENVKVEKYPVVGEMKYSLTFLRRFNDYTWDSKRINRTRRLFFKYTRTKDATWEAYASIYLGYVVNYLGLAALVERISRKYYLKENRSPEAYQRLADLKPDVLITTSPLLNTTEPGIVVAATNLNIPVLAFISSWDNLSTKSRFMFDFDGYILWSKQMEKDLNLFYPYAKKKPQYIVGAPQFDVFKNPDFYISKEDFCKQYGLDPSKKIVLYTLGSPNLFNELPGAMEFVKRAAKGDMGDIQVLVRPHPVKHNDPGLADITKLYNQAFIQTGSNPKNDKDAHTHDKDKIIEWVNTYKHVDIIIHTGSSTAIDGSFFDKGVINLEFDPSGENEKLVWHVSHTVHHYKPMVDLGGMINVSNYDQMVAAVNKYIQDPGYLSEGRKKLLKFACEFSDGKSGERYAEAILDFIGKQQKAK